MSAWRKIAEGLLTAIAVALLVSVIHGAWDEPPTRRNLAIGFALLFGSLVVMALVLFLRRRDVQYGHAAQDADATVRFCRPMRDMLTLLIYLLLAAIGAVFLLFAGQEVLVPGALMLAFVGLLLAGFYWRISRPVPTLTLSPAGLDFSPFNVGPIAWLDIERATMSRGRATVVKLKLADEAKYLRPGRRPFWAWGNRLHVRTSFAFIPTLFDASPRLIMHAIETRLSKFGRPDRAAPAKTV
jgi:hypothetical protein